MFKGHVKFDDDESEPNAPANTNKQNDIQVISTKNEETRLDSDEESDEDDAPQEEGLHSGKTEVETQISQREEAIRSEQSQLKSKRRKKNELYAKQKKTIKETEPVEETIAELPKELLENIDQREESSAQNPNSKHVNFDDFVDSDEEQEELAKVIKAKKRKTLKNLRKDSVKRGKFKVQLLSTTRDSKTLPPRKESSIMNSRDRWLNRKTLNKR